MKPPWPLTCWATRPRPLSPRRWSGIASPAVAPGLAKASALESTLRERHDENRYDRLGRVDPRGRFDRRGNLL
jgi:hypothetical protein